MPGTEAVRSLNDISFQPSPAKLRKNGKVCAMIQASRPVDVLSAAVMSITEHLILKRQHLSTLRPKAGGIEVI
jgi:hypothetical protein